MENVYKGQNKIRKAINDIAVTALVIYAIGGSYLNLATKTGHPSADIATGRSQPTAIEQILIDSVK